MWWLLSLFKLLGMLGFIRVKIAGQGCFERLAVKRNLLSGKKGFDDLQRT